MAITRKKRLQLRYNYLKQVPWKLLVKVKLMCSQYLKQRFQIVQNLQTIFIDTKKHSKI